MYIQIDLPMLNSDQRQKLAEVLSTIDTRHIATKSAVSYHKDIWTSEKIDQLKKGIENAAIIETGKFWAKTLLVSKGLDGVVDRVRLIGDLTSAVSYSVAHHIQQNSEYKLWHILDEEALLLYCSEVVRTTTIKSFVSNGL